jgi:hypothetical protein
LQTWVKCPKCNECNDLVRQNPLKRTKKNGWIVASKRIKCGFCGTTFYSDKGTRRENMGLDYGAGETAF